MIRRPPRSTLSSSSAASDVYKRQGEYRLVQPDGDIATLGRLGAPRAEWARITRLGELGQTAAFDVPPDGEGDPVRAGDGVVFEVDQETVLGKEPNPGVRFLGLALRLDALVFETGLDLAGAIRVVPVDAGTATVYGDNADGTGEIPHRL